LEQTSRSFQSLGPYSLPGARLYSLAVELVLGVVFAAD
jgi:hypothetical protein